MARKPKTFTTGMPEMNTAAAYKDFTTRLKLLINKQPELITTTLGNIFTMRLIGNKTGTATLPKSQ